MRGLIVVVGLSLVTAAANAAPPEAAAPGKGKAKPGALVPAFTVTPELKEKLKSPDVAVVRAALDDVRMAGPAAQAAAPLVTQLLERGTTAGLAEAALDTLGDLGAETASPRISVYASHREVAVRRAAVKALIKTKGAIASKTLRHALGDLDPMVRGVAATGLGTLKAKEAVGDLFVALDHKVGEAAAAIGQLCAPEECDKLMGKLGRLPFDVVTGGLDQILFRPPTDVSDDEKVKVVGRLRELGTAEANKYLKDVQGRWPKGWSQRVKQAIDQGVLATSGGAE